MSRVTHDRIAAPRQLPVPLDVAFAAFGNDQAGELLAPELLRWDYEDDLIRAREEVSWPSEGGIYLGWIDALRALSVDQGSLDGLPAVARTQPWGRRLIQTQLASWAELRRDTILYAKQSYGTMLCEYPDGYVDPYPEFYARMAEMARSGQRLTKTLAAVNPAFDCSDRHLVEDPACVGAGEGQFGAEDRGDRAGRSRRRRSGAYRVASIRSTLCQWLVGDISVRQRAVDSVLLRASASTPNSRTR